MARSPQGLASPRVSEAALQQWIDAVSLRVGGLAGEIESMSGVVGVLQEDAAAGEPTTGVSACLIAPQASGVEGFGGIGVAFITWANPLRACSNFASATVYRNTVDDYITSAMVGQSEWISFLDESVTDGTVYYYWVTWALTNGSVGPPSESVMVRTGFDPDRFHDELLADVRDDPLTRDLLSDITLPETIAAEIRRLAVQRSLILSDLVTLINTDVTQINTDVTRINTEQIAQQQEITSLEARLTGTMLGPVQNRFTGADRTVAETARDDYEAINPMVEFDGVTQAWLDHYDAEDDLNIILEYGVVLQYQRRVSGAWADNGQEQALASAVMTLSADLTSLQGEVTAFSTMLTQLQAEITGKADASAVTALETRVVTTETETSAQAQQITFLDAAVQDKAEASAVTALGTRVQSNEGSISSQSQQITSLLAQALGFAAATAVMEIASRVTVNEGSITSISSLITNLSSMIGDSASATALSLLASRVVTVEGQTVSLGTAITSLDASVAALMGDILTRATAAAVTALTARVASSEGEITSLSSSVTQLTADILERATAAAVTALTARVASSEGEITSLSSSVTQLTADILERATAAAVTALTARVASSEGEITSLSSFVTQLMADILDRATAAAVTALTARVASSEGEITSLSSFVTQLMADILDRATAAAVTALTARVASSEGEITSLSSFVTQLMADILDRATAAAVTALTARVASSEGEITSLSSFVTQLMADILDRATAAAVTALTARVASSEGDLTSLSSSVTQLMADILDRATAAAVTALTARVASSEGDLTSLSSSVTTLLADIPGLATVSAQEILEARVELVENVDGTTELAKLARWLVKTQVGDLVGGIGLYNDGASVRLTIAADRFVVLPPGFLNDEDARVPFAVDEGQVYLDDAIIRDASIGTAKILDGFLTNLAAVHGTIEFARITKGDIFDLSINNIIQSLNYTPASTGWVFRRDGTFELNAGSFRGEIRSTDYVAGVSGWRIAADGSAEFADIQNTQVLWRKAAGFHVSGGNTIFGFAMAADIRTYTYITGVAEVDSGSFGPFAYPSSALVSGQNNARPSGARRVAVVVGSIGRTTAVFHAWRSASGLTLYMQPADSDEDATFFEIVGIRNPRGFGAPPSGVSSQTGGGSTTTVTANAGSDVSVESGGSVGIGGTDTITNPGGTTTYAWARQSGIGGSLSSTTVASPTFNAPTVTVEATQVWRKTVTNNGVSDSDDVTVTVMPAAIQAPGTPSTPTLSSRTQTSLTLATVAGTGGAPTTYRWRYSDNSTINILDPIVTSSGPSVTIPDLDPDTNYWIDVRGENSEGDSFYSDDLATSTLAPDPTTVDANAGSDVSVESGGSVGIGGTDTITNPVGTTTYAWARVPGTGAGGSLSSSTISQPTFNAPTVTSERNIAWRKTTTNNGVSDTDDVTVTVMPPAAQAPGTPSTPTLTSRTSTSLTLATVAGTGGAPTTYRWHYSTNFNITDFDPIVTSSGPSVTIPDLDPDRNYWIDVRAENSQGSSSYSGDLETSTLEATPVHHGRRQRGLRR